MPLQERPNRKPTQCKKPTGWIGRLVLRNMNGRHSTVTDWGLAHVAIERGFSILDVGCGGGRTLAKLAAMARDGTVYGVDYSEASVAASRRLNAQEIGSGRVEVELGSVSDLPFPKEKFDLVTAVETHIWWPDLGLGAREIQRVLKPCGKLAVISEVYRGASTRAARACEKYADRVGMTLLDPAGHGELLAAAGYKDVQVSLEEANGWICAIGTK
jgi:ubiquinone/menaquinone biosynthesis C-methylase UbiE